MQDARILLLDLNPESGLGKTLGGILESSPNLSIHLRHESVGVFEHALAESNMPSIISRSAPDLILLILSLRSLKQSRALFQSIRKEASELPIIVVTEECKPDHMLGLLGAGASDFVTPPLKAIEVLPRVWRLLEHTHRSKTLAYRLKEKLGLKQLVGESPVFVAVINKIPSIASCDATVLISGETGTGKELCARAIHYLSPRMGKPFVPVDCGAIPTELMENELFGHVRGAFTGASLSQAGVIQEAEGGTLFLDDIDALPLSAQVKLLRLLQEKEYRRLGSPKVCQTDVRIISATNRDLDEEVRGEKFRQDLYYRLNIIPLVLPPLRERREDIPLLARHFTDKYAAEFKSHVTDFASEAMERLLLYEWPGNVRELEHVVQRAIVLSEHAVIPGGDIDLPGRGATDSPKSFKEEKAKAIAQFERSYIQGLLIAHGGNISRAARAAQKNRRAFWQLVRKHRIDVQSFKPG
ncbi:MAG: sigma-54 dependent transcriptional regulator [Candidatus Hodarchaeota archaeon]